MSVHIGELKGRLHTLVFCTVGYLFGRYVQWHKADKDSSFYLVVDVREYMPHHWTKSVFCAVVDDFGNLVEVCP